MGAEDSFFPEMEEAQRPRISQGGKIVRQRLQETAQRNRERASQGKTGSETERGAPRAG